MTDDVEAMRGDIIRLQEREKTIFSGVEKIERRLGRIEVFIAGIVLSLAAVAIQFVGKQVGIL